MLPFLLLFFFFFNDTATTEIYTLSLHDALPILSLGDAEPVGCRQRRRTRVGHARPRRDRKSTRLNSSHQIISYAVFCLKKKKNLEQQERTQECKHELRWSTLRDVSCSRMLLHVV